VWRARPGRSRSSRRSRRLFSSDKSNPTLGTIAEVAAALGMRITVEPLPKDEQRQVTVPLFECGTADAKSLARHLSATTYLRFVR